MDSSKQKQLDALTDQLEGIAETTGDTFLKDHLFWPMFHLLTVVQKRKVIQVAEQAVRDYY